MLQHEEIREQTRAAREDIPTTVSDMVRMPAEAHTFRSMECMCDLSITEVASNSESSPGEQRLLQHTML